MMIPTIGILTPKKRYKIEFIHDHIWKGQLTHPMISWKRPWEYNELL